MDEIMRRMQSAANETAAVRLSSLQLRMAVEWALTGDQRLRDIGGRAMAKIIEFYIPNMFRRRGKWIPPEKRGKVIEFVPIIKKTA